LPYTLIPLVEKIPVQKQRSEAPICASLFLPRLLPQKGKKAQPIRKHKSGIRRKNHKWNLQKTPDRKKEQSYAWPACIRQRLSSAAAPSSAPFA